MKKLLIFLGLALACAAEPSLQAMQPSVDAKPANTLKTSFCLAGGAGIYEGYKRLNSCFWQNKQIKGMVVDFEKTLLEQAVEDIYLALTLNSTIAAIKEELTFNLKIE